MPMQLPPPGRAPRGMRVSYRGNVEVVTPGAITEAPRIVTSEPAVVHRADIDQPIVELRRIASSLGIEDLTGSKEALVGRITAARG